MGKHCVALLTFCGQIHYVTSLLRMQCLKKYSCLLFLILCYNHKLQCILVGLYGVLKWILKSLVCSIRGKRHSGQMRAVFLLFFKFDAHLSE